MGRGDRIRGPENRGPVSPQEPRPATTAPSHQLDHRSGSASPASTPSEGQVARRVEGKRTVDRDAGGNVPELIVDPRFSIGARVRAQDDRLPAAIAAGSARTSRCAGSRCSRSTAG